MEESFREEDDFDDAELWPALLEKIACKPVLQEQEHIIGDNPSVRVTFPYQAYPSQELLMSRMIEGVQKSENCLLESPTGTGKTAAILCALLAWQRNCKRRADYCWNIDKFTVEQGCTCGLMEGNVNDYKISQSQVDGKVVLRRFTYEYVEMEVPIEETSLNETFSTTISSPKKKKVEVRQLKSKPDDVRGVSKLCRFCIRTNYRASEVPTIYYATRTISQVEQVVSQLKRTAYSTTKMTILASRKHTCINTAVQTSESGVDDVCQQLRQNYTKNQKRGKIILPQCPYYNGGVLGYNDMVYTNFNRSPKEAWDIEDLNKYSKQEHGCSYYGTQILLNNAEIVFCTYNYLLHPGIRSSTKINLINSIIVFDEAHNIEDLCRNIASIELKQPYLLTDVIPAFVKAFENPGGIPKDVAPSLSSLLTLFRELVTLMDLNCGTIKFNRKDQTEGYNEFSNEEIVSKLDKVGLNVPSILEYNKQIKILEASISGRLEEGSSSRYSDEEQAVPTSSTDNENNEKLKFNINVIRFMKNLMSKLEFCLGSETRLQDFRGVFVKRVKQWGKPITYSNEFLFICLNPALTFEPLRNRAHSIIVASGTLSPLESFESELDTQFAIKLSAPHVIKQNQVLAGVASFGPEKINLCFNQEGQRLSENQEELGRSIVEICKIVPHGVLVFLPSYSWMNNLQNCWSRFPQTNTIIQQLEMIKHVYFEERKDKNKYQRDIEDYRKKIVESSKGCILFAVFRGKVSEGVDFKDNQARAVITVGIPFSCPGDPNIKYKMNYNQSLVDRGVRKVLNGRKWYTTQAFRAMNQAFGRCVRHEKDWGSLIFLEKRMTHRDKLYNISTWVKNNIKFYSDFDEIIQKLSNFMKERLLHDQSSSLTLENNNMTETIIDSQSNIPASPILENNMMDTVIVSQSDIPTLIVDVNDAAVPVELNAQILRSSTPITNESEVLNQSSEMSIFSNDDSDDSNIDIETQGPTDEPYSPIRASQSNHLTDRLSGSVRILSP